MLLKQKLSKNEQQKLCLNLVDNQSIIQVWELHEIVRITILSLFTHGVDNLLFGQVSGELEKLFIETRNPWIVGSPTWSTSSTHSVKLSFVWSHKTGGDRAPDRCSSRCSALTNISVDKKMCVDSMKVWRRREKLYSYSKK